MHRSEDTVFLSQEGTNFPICISYIFGLNGPNHFIFGPQHNINKINIFWSFGENPTWWRHFTSRDVILPFFVKNCWKCADVSKHVSIMGLLNFTFWKKHYISFHLRVSHFHIITGWFCISVEVEVLILAHFSWRHRKNADVSRKYWCYYCKQMY